MPTPTEQALILCNEQGIVSTENQKKISTAVAAAASMPAITRSFDRVDQILDVRLPSPVRQARAALSSLQQVWAGATDKFHAFRQQAFEVRLLQAKLNKKRKHPPEDPDDAAIWEAECGSDQAKIDALIATIAAHRGEVEQIVSKATYYADQYARLGTSMSAEDFMRDDAEYLVQTTFWHAAKTFSLISPGDKKRSAGQKWREAVVRTPAEVRTMFQALGIGSQEGNELLKDLADQKRTYDLAYQMNGQYAEPFPYDVHWLKRCSEKFTSRVLASMKENGPEWAARIQKLVDPSSPEKGTDTTPEHWRQERGVALE
jgi:NAD(P)-dependent dehydrogenase (short-subunit alcohol dehydrogenase family)